MAQQPNIQLRYIDRPEISETYADSIERISVQGPTATIEFCVTRLDEPKPAEGPSGRKYTACRLVLPMPAFIDLTQQLQRMMTLLEQQGLIKKDTTQIVMPPVGGKLN